MSGSYTFFSPLTPLTPKQIVISSLRADTRPWKRTIIRLLLPWMTETATRPGVWDKIRRGPDTLECISLSQQGGDPDLAGLMPAEASFRTPD